MIDNILIIVRLVLLTVLLSAGVVTFTLVNASRLPVEAERELPGCGGVIYANDYERIPEDGSLQHGWILFQGNCAPCHALRQKKVGPALAYTFERRDSLWLVQMILDGAKLVKSGDTAAVKLFNQFDKIEHPAFTNFDDKAVRDLVLYLKETDKAMSDIY